MERVPGGYIGAIPAQNAASRPGVATMEQTLEAMEREGTVPFPGNDPLADYVTLLLDVEDVNGKIVDESGRNHIVQVWNNCIVTENDRRIGSSSMFFNGNSSFIEIPSSYDLHVGTSDFTLECWFKILTQKEQAIVSKEQVSTGTSGILLYFHTDFTLRFLAGNGSSWFVSMATSFVPLPGVWYHVAVSRNERSWAMFVNGAIVGSAISSSGVWYGQTSRPLQIGRYTAWNDATKDFHGYIDKVRLTERIVRYPTNFSVATSELPTDISGDPYFNNTSLLLLMNGSNGSTTFADSSSSGSTVTANGNAQISTTQSKFGGASAYFDGSGDWLTVNSTTVANFGTSDFTIEAWIYKSSTTNIYASIVGNSTTPFQSGSACLLVSTSGIISLVSNPTNPCVASNTAINLNTWYHVAVIRNGNRFSLFLNGILDGSGTASDSINLSSGNLLVGRNGWDVPQSYWHGYIDDLRITKGVARYPAPFAPPSRPVGFIPVKTGDPYFMDVGLLLRAEGSDGSRTFADSSRRNLAITPVGGINTVTANGNVQISTTESKFGGSSAVFDGTGDYLSLANQSAFGLGVGDFTVEAWIYITGGQGNDRGITDFRSASSGEAGTFFIDGPAGNRLAFWYGSKLGATGTALSLNTWYHVALTRQSGVFRCHLNGAQEWATTASVDFGSTRPLGIGGGVWSGGIGSSPFFGYIDDLRITKGIARYTSSFTPPTAPHPSNANNDPFYQNVSLLLSMNGTNGSIIFTDSSITGSAVSTITSKVGSASAFFKGDGYLSIPDSDAFDLAGTDFTIETWVRPVGNSANTNGTYYSCIAASDVSGSRGWVIFLGGTPTSMDRLVFEGYTNNTTVTVITAPYNFTMNTWHHIAITRAQNRLYMFSNGKLLNKDGTAFSITMQNSTSVLKVGAHEYDSTYRYYFTGFIDEFRITKNVARYISDFTPSTSPLPDSYKATGADPYGKYTTFLLRAEGPNGYTLIRDSSYVDNPITVNGNAAISTTDKKFGNSSLYFDGSGDYLDIPQEVFRFEREDFTIEYWVNLETNTQQWPYQMSSSNWNSNGWYSHVNGSATGWGGASVLNWVAGSGSSYVPSLQSTTTFRGSGWKFVSITRSGGFHTLWVDGVPESMGYSLTANYLGNRSRIFSSSDTSGNLEANTSEKGYLDEMRVTRGLARYSPTITVPTTEFISDANTSLLLLMNGANNSTTFTDSSSNALTVTPSGDAKIVTSLSVFGGASAFFDGTGDFLSVPNSNLFNFGTGDFTIEAWIYPIGNMGRLITSRATQAAASGTWSFGVDSLTSTTTLSFTEVVSGEPGPTSGALPFSIRNQWNHVAVARTSNITRIFLNGNMIACRNQTTNFNNISYPVYICTSPNESVSHGYVDSVRITKGVGRYVGSFTPPTAAFPDP